ncbi:TetR/AcrR family transcriptional regulator [Actinocorallia sp. A-T 12471]|uniref:TetR/AcrR family transcriptional regulator n=1 Tax=Actinocorallia sp. A-T 12471 TaxID=3089813 RepID=UPI0029D10955|nr:TetR/AcrR family transcriptional regulator [Actinocorallia sp. A-T 12471]MDX6740151.1 TetR/AcrR family transcriptional regulator [Actinocorallia sp. A-T 12471]
MDSENTVRDNRLVRRKARTRAALIGAAQRMLAERNRVDASVQQITDAADVGFGSFYNHFTSKAQLFEAAIAETLDQHAGLVQEATAAMDDPAEVFAASVRLTGRLRDSHPRMARILLHTGLPYLTREDGITAHVMHDLAAAESAGRLRIGDPRVAVACVGGALLGLLQTLDSHPGLDARAATHELAANLLRMFGLPDGEARDVVARPLPALPRPVTGTAVSAGG